MSRRDQIVDDLRSVLEAQDGRTLVEMREAEPHYDIVVTRADPGEDGTSIGFGEGWGTYLTGRAIRVGDTITFWDGNTEPGFGERHGWAHNGELVEWLTPFERIAKRVGWLASYDREQRERMEREAAQRHSAYSALPEPLRKRIDRFAAERADFWLNGSYELFCCTEAAKIADYLRARVEAGGDAEAVVRAFYDDREDQAKVPIDGGHSGNTFGGACSLARALLAGESP